MEVDKLLFPNNTTLPLYNSTTLPLVFANIAFPSPVRQLFTYKVAPDLQDAVAPGKRVWVPLRGRMAIGMVIQIHTINPDFECKAIARVLDADPVLDEHMIWLVRWMHHYYFCSVGEATQAALPAGYNFISVSYLQPTTKTGFPKNTKGALIVDEIRKKGRYNLKEAERRWDAEKRALKELVRQGYLEIWDDPELSSNTGSMLVWNTTDTFSAQNVLGIIESYTHKRAPAWVNALSVLLECEFPITQAEAATLGLTTPLLRRIAKEELIISTTEALRFRMNLSVPIERPKILNKSQQQALENIEEAIRSRLHTSFLLFGVTGSGKTEVYIHAIQQVLDQGRSAILLVPEIALTPQTVRRFAAVFGNTFAVLHSRLSDRERMQAWTDLRDGHLNLVIGARSAVFAPVKNLGIVIIDEEHDSSYKQEDPAPRYHARDVAIMRAHRENAVVLMGSATPSIAAYKAAMENKFQLLELPSRPFSNIQPEVRVIDLRQYRSAMRGPLAVPLYNAIKERLELGEQSLLLYNRRGFANYMQCPSCGDIPQCPSCSVSLTYHKPYNQLRCHYCGYAELSTNICSACDAGEELTMSGSGTQQVEDSIIELFSDARVLRMDQDTTRGRYGHERLLGAFARGEADILVGTQLVAKGLDFPNLTLAGVVNADTELAFPSYRSGERMFQLLTQVSGRPGRAEKPGLVYLQTKQPDHPALKWASKHDYRGFAAQELPMRRDLLYPPYSRLITIVFRAVDPDAVRIAATFFGMVVKTHYPNVPFLGPAPSVIVRLHAQFRWEAQIKAEMHRYREVEQMLEVIVATYERDKPKEANAVKYAINVDAV